MFHEKWTCEVKGIRHPVSVVYRFACGWTVGEGFDEVTKGHRLLEGWEAGDDITKNFTFCLIRGEDEMCSTKHNLGEKFNIQCK